MTAVNYESQFPPVLVNFDLRSLTLNVDSVQNPVCQI